MCRGLRRAMIGQRRRDRGGAGPVGLARLGFRVLGLLRMLRERKRQGLGRKTLPAVVRDVERHVDAVAGLLGDGEWLVGDALSLADLSVFAELACIRGSDEGARVIEGRPAVVAWMARVDRATAKP